MVSCSTSKLAEESKFSGFLPDYTRLTEVEVKSGGAALKWLDPELAQKGYTKAILEPTVVYPAPLRDSEEARVFIEDALTYLDYEIQGQVGQEVIITDNPGYNTVRVRFALTGVETSTEKLAGYEYIPVTMVIAGTKSLLGTRAQTVEIYFEAILEDSISGEILGLVVRKGFGESLENESMVLTKDNIYPQLDRWAKDARNIAKLLE
jgi:hypothetical protein